MNRLDLFRLSLGLTVGFILGLRLALEARAHPAQVTPGQLGAQAQAQYQILVAQAYASTGDLPRALARLEALGGPADPRALTDLAQQLIAGGERDQPAIDLVSLAAAMMNRPPTPQPQPSPPATPLPAAPALQPTQPLRYHLVEQQSQCDAALTEPLLKIQVLDAQGTPVPGVRALVVWDGGADQFVTGLDPAQGPGYADFVMAQGETYNLALENGAAYLYAISAPPCERGAGALSITFQAQP